MIGFPGVLRSVREDAFGYAKNGPRWEIVCEGSYFHREIFFHNSAQQRGGTEMVNITETAAVKVKEVLHQQNLDSGYLRVYIAGFG